jgi:hypothetical protein
VLTTAANCGTGKHTSVTLTSGVANNTSYNFGNFRDATKSGTKYNDVTGNGVVNVGDLPLTGYTMYADLDNNGLLDVNEPSGATNANGVYSIPGLTPGVTYKIREDQHTDWTCTFPATADAFGCYWSFTPTSGQTETNNNFLNWSPPKGCTLTIGFWKTHTGFGAPKDAYNNAWFPIWLGTVPAGGVEGANGSKSVKVDDRTESVFYLSKAFDASNGVNKLYAQLLGAKLNILSGADPGAVSAYITEADGLLAQYNAASWTANFAKSNTGKRIVFLASKFDAYNNGQLVPAHCR